MAAKYNKQLCFTGDVEEDVAYCDSGDNKGPRIAEVDRKDKEQERENVKDTDKERRKNQKKEGKRKEKIKKEEGRRKTEAFKTRSKSTYQYAY
jgi:hypothetical protein